MSSPEETTVEGRFLQNRPDVKEMATKDPRFDQYRASFPTAEIDGVRYYIRGGDELRDAEQLLFDWATEVGVITRGETESEPGPV